VQNARDYRTKLDEAVRDPLTGVYNRRFFDEALDKELERTRRFGGTVSVVLFDVDDFKVVNDALGHGTGDEVLRRVGELVTPLVRGVDSFCRLGGEEFGLILPETGQLDALLVAERLRAAVARQDALPGRRITVSAGVASAPDDGLDREDVVRRADAALYWAKRNGKNLCAVASEVTEGPDEERDLLAANLYALVAATDGRHLHTRSHSENVATYAVAIGQELGLDGDRIVHLRRAAFLHDVGKIVVPHQILEKAGKPTPEEWEQLRVHPDVGATMLEHAGLREEARWVRHHHERFDGDGYPAGVAGVAIPLEARIIFAADSFEAMTSDRPYRRGMPLEDAVAELERCAGTQFDPRVVEALVRLEREGRLVAQPVRG
jgi:diguanylate cyclase (GGDEF)-like protein